MKFLTLCVQNFLSFSNNQEFKLNSLGLAALIGKNGAGKSSLLEAIVWVLFGKTLRGYTGDDVVNNKKNSDCVVILELQDENDKSYKIIRGRKPKSLTFSIDSEDKSLGTDTDTQELINLLIGMDHKTFEQSILLSFGIKPFATLTNRDKYIVFEDILGAGSIADAAKKIEKQKKKSQSDLEEIDNRLHSLVSRLRQQENMVAQLKEVNKSFEYNKQQRINKLEEKIADIENSTPKLVISIIQLEHDLACRVNEIDEIQSIIDDLIAEVIRHGNEISRAQAANYLAKADVDKYKKESEKITSMSGSVCPTCTQVVKKEITDYIINSMASEIAEAGAALVATTGELSELINRKNLLLNEKNNLSDKSDALQDEKEKIKRQIELSKINTKKIHDNEESIRNLQSSIDAIKAESNALNDVFATATEMLNSIEMEKRGFESIKSRLEEQVLDWTILSDVFGTSGIKHALVCAAMPYLNQRAQHYADLLCNGNVEVKFTTNSILKGGESKEEFDISVKNRKGSEVYHGNSLGERQRIDIAIGWALGDLAATRASKRIQFRALDEPFRDLDEEGQESLMRLLRASLAQHKTILVVSHDETLQDQFATKYIIEKNYTGSFITLAT